MILVAESPEIHTDQPNQVLLNFRLDKISIGAIDLGT